MSIIFYFLLLEKACSGLFNVTNAKPSLFKFQIPKISYVASILPNGWKIGFEGMNVKTMSLLALTG